MGEVLMDDDDELMQAFRELKQAESDFEECKRREAAPVVRETIRFQDIEIPIMRAGMPDLFVALKPPHAQPYVMAPFDIPPQAIVEFFTAHAQQMEELRNEMLKRFEKSPNPKCRYQTGDVAYVMGRPFQLRVYPIAKGGSKMKAGARMRTRAKFSVDFAVSLLTLYVVHPKNYDEAKLAFNGYAEPLLLRNAVGLVDQFAPLLLPGEDAPTVRMRAMRGRWSSYEAGVLWLSTDLIPYPPDCLVYVIWKELEKLSEVDPEIIKSHFQRVLPGWREAHEMLQTRPEPYNLQ